jgi:shikimate dehydrogenase
MIDNRRLDFRGAAVTLPHKANLLRFVLERGGRADALTERIGAANTLIVGSAGGLACTNTDAPAAIESLCEAMDIDTDGLAGKRIALLGAGGVAQAVLAGLLDAGADVTVFNRTHQRAAELVEALESREDVSGERVHVAVGGPSELAQRRFDIYVNCTSIGMAGGPAPDASPLDVLSEGADVPMNDATTVFDTVYTPVRTPLIAEAEARGARVVTGIEMFLKQAAMQFELWTGKDAPLGAMNRSIADA